MVSGTTRLQGPVITKKKIYIYIVRFRLPKESKRIRTIDIPKRPKERRRDSSEGKDGRGKFPEGYASHLRIQYPTPTLLAASI